MTKYIDAKQAIETFKKVLPITPRSCGKTNIYMRWISALSEAWNDIPSADVQPVVRCKECRWWNEGYCRLIKYETTDDWFCADGWRKI